MMITSKTGAIIDGNKVDRETFFETLNTWGKTKGKRFVVIHHSILSEGINVKGLEAVLFMRNMDYIGISQNIGRLHRLPFLILLLIVMQNLERAVSMMVFTTVLACFF